MTRDDSRALWESTKANQERLRACAGPHEFEDVTPEKPIGKKHRCRVCNGEVHGTDLFWYRDGLAHGRAETQAQLSAIDAIVAEAGIGVRGPEDTLSRRVARLVADANETEERLEREVTLFRQERDHALANVAEVEKKLLRETERLTKENARLAGVCHLCKLAQAMGSAGPPLCICGAVESQHPVRGCDGYRPRGGRACPGCSQRTYRADGVAHCTDCEGR